MLVLLQVVPDSYLQYGALGILFAVLMAIFWRATPQVGRFIERNIESLGKKIEDGLNAIGIQVGEMRKDVANIENRHAENITNVNGRLDKIDGKIDSIGTKVETLVSRKD